MLDTDICIYLIRRKSEEIVRRIVALSPGDACISAVTFAELLFGAEKSKLREKNMAALDAFLLPFIVAPFDATAAKTYGVVRATLETQGTPIGALDTMIASHALAMQLDLATNNVREFSRVSGLRVVDWTN